MNCEDARRHWNLYHDSEGDAELHFRIADHLAGCSACAQWFAEQSRLEGLIVESMRSGQPTPELWSRVLGASELAPPRPRLGRLGWLLALAAGIVLVALAWGISVPSGESPSNLASLSALWHERLERGEETLQYRSNSDLMVEKYLRQRVSFPVRCPPRRDAGFAVEGAGVFRLGEVPAAYLHGLIDQSRVSIFVLHRDQLAGFKEYRQLRAATSPFGHREGIYQVAMASIDQNTVIAIGQAHPDQLNRVLTAYGSYPHHD